MATAVTTTTTCNSKMTFNECELAILRERVDENESIIGRRVVNNQEVQRMIQIVENFLISKKLICYGGTAINNILPKDVQFYDYTSELPDYDCFSMHAYEDVQKLADIFKREKFDNIEARSGVHEGTYKLFVNFYAIADLTQLDPILFKSLQKETIVGAGIYYASPNFLRLAMYKELSHPEGEISRWEKVLKRLTLFNEYFPLEPEKQCNYEEFQRKFTLSDEQGKEIYYLVRDSFIEQELVFFGGYAASMYAQYLRESERAPLKTVPDFDVFSIDPMKSALIVQDSLKRHRIRRITLQKEDAIQDFVPAHVRIYVGDDVVAIIHQPIGCHNYNEVEMKEPGESRTRVVRIATIDTMLNMYLIFSFSPVFRATKNRLLCMSALLFHVQQENRLKQKGVLKRFVFTCYGKDLTVQEMKQKKNELYSQLKKNHQSEAYRRQFLKYVPAGDDDDAANSNRDNKSLTQRRRRRRRTPRRRPADRFFVLGTRRLPFPRFL
jgi:hypothetical protein